MGLRHEDVLQVLLDARGLKRLILSFERKVTFRLSCAQLSCQDMLIASCGKTAQHVYRFSWRVGAPDLV